MKKFFVFASLLVVLVMACGGSAPATEAPAVVPSTPTMEPCAKPNQVFFESINNSNEEITFFWMEPNSEEKFYATTKPGERFKVCTYEAHVWTVRDPEGLLVMSYTATADLHQQVDISQEMVDNAVSDEAPAFFTEDFSGGLDAWSQLLLSGEGEADPGKLTVTTGGSGVNVNLDAKLLYLYYFYTPYTYENVSLKMNASNKGANSFQTLLVCRATDTGWYEFAMQNDGLWFLYAYVDGQYKTIGNGGATNIKTGQETNEIGMDCVGDQISLFVNDKELSGSPVKDGTFSEGQIGFSVASLQVTPVNVDVNSIEISEK